MKGGGTDRGDIVLSSTDSSVSSISLSGEKEEGKGSPVCFSGRAVCGRVPPNTPRESDVKASNDALCPQGEQYITVGNTVEDTDHSGPIFCERGINQLTDGLHTILPHDILGHTSSTRQESMPDGNSYHYVYDALDYHMCYHQDADAHASYANDYPDQSHPQSLQYAQPHQQPPQQSHMFTQYHRHNLCPSEYDRIDEWRIFADTFTPSPVPSPDCRSVIFTPHHQHSGGDGEDGSGTNAGGGSAPTVVSPALLRQKLRVLSDDLKRAPEGIDEGSLSHGAALRSGRRRCGTVNGRMQGDLRGRADGVFEEQNKGLLAELDALDLSSLSPSPAPSRTTSRKHGRGGTIGSISSHRMHEEGLYWVEMDGGVEVPCGMAVGLLESPTSEPDCQWDAPKPKFLQKLFK